MLTALIQWIRQHSRLSARWIRLSLGILLGISIPLLMLALRVNAAETVLLQYRDLRLAVPLTELQHFTQGEEVSEELQTFLQQTQEDPTEIQKWLTAEIAPPQGQVLPEEFALFQINKTLGEPLERQDLESLKVALRDAYRDNSAFSVMEILEHYPRGEVRLTLNRLNQVYTDIHLYVTRIYPVLKLTEMLLPELLCDCDRLPSEAIEGAYRQSHQTLQSLWAIADKASATQGDAVLKDMASAPSSLTVSTTVPQPSYEDKQVVLTFGPFRPSITVGELTTFAETGELSKGWQFYLQVAKVDSESLRKALTEPIHIDVRFLDRMLNSFLGEYLLYEVGQILQTPSGEANIQALRSAMILAAVDDNQFSLLELFQHYPTPQLQINGVRLARVGSKISRIQSQFGAEGGRLDIEQLLVYVRSSVAEEVCDCDPDIPAEAQAFLDVPPPTLSENNLTQFLPANWQPVPSHREDFGPIKVVWLTGTPYDMGRQHGELLHHEIASLGKNNIDIARYIGKGLGFGHLAQLRSYPDVVEECRGLSEAASDIGITMDVCMMAAYADVFQEVLGYTLPKELFWDGCNQFVAAKQATADGYLYHGSSVDNDEAPVPYVIDNPIVFVRQPTGLLPHVFVAYPGVVWPNSGMNVAGISLGLDTAHPNSPNELSMYGRSNVQIMAQILAKATSFSEARTIMETQPRVRANLIMITDGKSQEAGVFEFTGKSLAVRSLQENGVLYTTNHFALPEMYDKQALPPDPSSISRFDRFQQLLEPDQPTSYYGQITPETMATILRDRVNPYTKEKSPFEVFDDDASPGGNGALRQAIYDPGRLRFWVAAGQPPVPENPFVCFSMGELLGFSNATPCESPSM